MTFDPIAHTRLTRRGALRHAGVATVGVAILPVLQACGPEQQAAQPPATSPPAGGAVSAPTAKAGEHVVEMNDQLRFVPDELTIEVGETVTWTTVGVQPHTTTADPEKAQDPAHVKLPEGAEPWDSGLLNRDQSWSHTFEVPGEYAYFCIPHESQGMLATLTVTP